MIIETADMRIIRRLMVVPFLGVIAPLAIAAEDDSADATDVVEGERCISTRTIRRTNVIDDGNVVFQVVGGRLYLNRLPEACRGLARERRFSYVTHMSRLCEFDRINILQDSGIGLFEGRACKLGRFWPVTREDLDALFSESRAQPKPRPVDPPPIEDVVSDEEADSPPAAKKERP